MADSGRDKKDKNEFKDTRNRWWIWTAVAIVIFIILLFVFNRKSIVVADEDTPTAVGMVSPGLDTNVRLVRSS